MDKTTPRTSYLTSCSSILKSGRQGGFLKPPALRGSANTIAGSPHATTPQSLLRFYPASATLASRTSSISSADSMSLSLPVAESSRTLKSLSGGYSDRARGRGVEAEMNTKGPGKKNAAVEANVGKRALASEVGLGIAQVKPLVLTRVLTEKYRGVEGEGFVCLG